MKVHEIMTGHARSVAPDASLVEIAGLMRELDVGAVPVVDGDTVAGIVTDRDIVVRGLADGKDPSSMSVADVMSGGIELVFADDEVEDAVRIMEQHQIRRLPVLDREKRLVGIISIGDIATSSNPAFSGMALRDVSQPNEPSARRRRLSRQSESGRMPTVPGSRRGPAGARRGAATQSRRGSSGSGQESARRGGKSAGRSAGKGGGSAAMKSAGRGKKAARSRR